MKWSSGRSSLGGWRLTLAELWKAKEAVLGSDCQVRLKGGTLTALGPLHSMGQPLGPTDQGQPLDIKVEKEADF